MGIVQTNIHTLYRQMHSHCSHRLTHVDRHTPFYVHIPTHSAIRVGTQGTHVVSAGTDRGTGKRTAGD